MNKIIFKDSGKEVDFTDGRFPIIVHGLKGSGESLFSISIAVKLFQEGRRLLFFTAYPYAKDEFLTQIGKKLKKVFYIDEENKIEEALSYQAVIVESGNIDLCLKVLKKLKLTDNFNGRTVFIKNIDAILTKEIFDVIVDYKNLLLSGDIDQVDFFDESITINFKTKILFSLSKKINIGITEFPKHIGFLMSGDENGYVTLEI